MVRFELALLAELGFGLDLTSCAARGVRDDLIYVSPRSGRAVSRAAGEPWRDRLLRLPEFLIGETEPSAQDLADGFALTGFFLSRHVFEPRNLPATPARESFIAAVMRVNADSSAGSRQGRGQTNGRP
jgi:DNA repair protein RecO (recombination protein O)